MKRLHATATSWFVATLAIVALLLGGCGDSTDANTKDKVGAAVDIVTDTAVTDTTTATDTSAATDTGPSDSCPGGTGCPCAANDECDAGLCIEGPDGKQCARTCVDSCDKGFACAQVPQGSDVVLVCVSSWSRLCLPCTESKECIHPGISDARCIDGGAAGSFCGNGCGDDDDCPSEHGCKDAKDVDGNTTKQCLPTDGAGKLAACTCNKNAVFLATKTTCSKSVAQGGKELVCKGTAQCKEAGKAAVCEANDPDEEKCDGVDNDCDGQTDEASCDDGNVCTKDACAPSKGDTGCSNDLVKDGTGCDADGSVCTVDDTCKAGKCEVGSAKNCDDKNSCTKDSCDLSAGCTQVVDDGVPCDDENPCTVGDVCKAAVCKAGKAKECTSTDLCVEAKCDLTKGGKCGFKNKKKGTTCDDGDACTKDDGCDDGSCGGIKLKCDDNNGCTDDSCGAKTGCKSANNTTKCEDGDACTEKGTCSGGACKSSKLNCDDNNPCTKDSCDSKEGCGHDKLADEAQCTQDGKKWCMAGKCVDKKEPGKPCELAKQCASGVCADGVCCDDKCGGVCRSCLGKHTGGKDGQCKPVVVGKDPDTDCKKMDVSTCANTGVCDGAGQCHKYKSGTVCKAAMCLKDGSVQAQSTCGGNGCGIGNVSKCETSDPCKVASCAAAKCAVKAKAEKASCSADGKKWCVAGKCVASSKCPVTAAHIKSPADVKAILQCVTLTSLSVAQTASVVDVTLPNLTTVVENVSFHQVQGLKNLSLPQLTSIGGNLYFHQNLNLKYAGTQSLTKVGGYLYLHGNTKLTMLRVSPAPSAVGKYSYFHGNSALDVPARNWKSISKGTYTCSKNKSCPACAEVSNCP
jgi:hypothetical protein